MENIRNAGAAAVAEALDALVPVRLTVGQINVGVEGINLLRGDQNQYCVNNKALLCFQGLTDRRITAGLSVKF